jgi:hypothetical protein
LVLKIIILNNIDNNYTIYNNGDVWLN